MQFAPEFMENCFISALTEKIIWAYDYICIYIMLARVILTRELFVSHSSVNATKLGDHKGKVAVVTGGTGEIGSTVVKKLLQSDIRVILGVPDIANTGKLLARLHESKVTSGKLEAYTLDLSSFASVHEFVKTLKRRKICVNILINNASIFGAPFALTEDGFESQFQINYLSHFLLINLLLTNMKETALRTGIPGRIVMVSNSMHCCSKVDFNDIDLQAQNKYNPYRAYFNTKWMVALMARQMDEKLKERNININVNSLHPGAIPTVLASHIAKLSLPIVSWLLQHILANEEYASDEILYVSLSPDTAENHGEYFVRQKPMPIPYDCSNTRQTLGPLMSSNWYEGHLELNPCGNEPNPRRNYI